MVINLSKQQIKDLEDFDAFMERVGLLPRYWIDHTEWSIKKERFKKVLEKIQEQTK